MSVGTLAGMHVSVGSTYIDITFTRPSNCTKIVFIVTPTNLVGAAISHTYTIPLVYAPNASITYRFTGLSSTQTYYLTGTPYNGSAAGTVRNYSNSGSTPVNSIRMPSAKITTPTPTSSTTVKSPTTSSSGSGAVSPTSPVGSTTNNGTVATSGAASTNTPKIIPGATDATVPSDLNSPSRLSLKIPDLAPNQTYSIKVRALTTDSAGKTVYSEYSSPIYLTTPGFGADGTNILSLNNNGDLQLAGGSIFAGDFGVDAGLIDVVNGTTTGTGVILNKTGLAGFAAGTKEFYIDAATGNAYFAGTIQSTIIESNSYSSSDPTDGSGFSTGGMAINLTNGSFTAKNFRIDTSGNAYFGGSITANADISGTPAYTVVDNARVGAALSGTVYTISSNYLKMVGDQISNATGQLSAVSANGTTFYSGSSPSSGPRLLINQYGILGYSDTNTISFGVNSTSSSISGTNITIPAGSAYFSGAINATSGYIGTTNGWAIQNSYISSKNGSIVLDAYQEQIKVGGATITSYNDGSNVGITTWTGGSQSAAMNIWHTQTYWTLSYNNTQIMQAQAGGALGASIWIRNMLGYAYNGQSSYPAYGPNDARIRNIGYGNTGTATPTDVAPYAGPGDVYLGY